MKVMWPPLTIPDPLTLVRGDSFLLNPVLVQVEYCGSWGYAPRYRELASLIKGVGSPILWSLFWNPLKISKLAFKLLLFQRNINGKKNLVLISFWVWKILLLFRPEPGVYMFFVWSYVSTFLFKIMPFSQFLVPIHAPHASVLPFQLSFVFCWSLQFSLSFIFPPLYLI